MASDSEARAARLRAALLTERSAHEALAAEHDASAAALEGNTDVDSILEREVAEASAARARETVVDIDVALARLDAGSYGTCERCGRPIAGERLEAIPHARSCVSCPTGRPPGAGPLGARR